MQNIRVSLHCNDLRVAGTTTGFATIKSGFNEEIALSLISIFSLRKSDKY